MPQWPRLVVGCSIALVLAGATGCATGMRASSRSIPLPQRLDALLAEPPFDGVQWGVLVADAGSGRTLYERNPAVRFVPASNQKLLVTAAAMGLLGSEYRWKTPFLARTLPENGVLEGDLILVGSGDPSLGEPFFESADDALGAFVSVLREAGVQRIAGALVLDASAWDSTSAPGSWMVEDLVATAGATGGPFALSRGELEIRVIGGLADGDPARVGWSPMGASTFVEAGVLTESQGLGPSLVVDYLPERRRWRVTGTIPVGQESTRIVPARDPVRLAVEALERAMEKGGIVIEGGVRIHWDRDVPISGSCLSGALRACPELVLIAERWSPPLPEVTAAILGPSQNWMTEQLVRTLGAEVGSAGSWPEGLRAVRGHLTSAVGVDSFDLRMEDGSGLSTKNLISPRAVVAILSYVRSQPWFRTYLAGMAYPGGLDTTLEGRLSGLEGRVFAKTGTLSNVNSLSGYLLRDDGREVVFSILSNGSNLPSAAMGNRIDAVVRELARVED
ncbi:MAG: D-alanyl-D-alanine carboxypeptidase/D-alanyl-D-alanine-endopeptidase [Gemmatimonadetes bacterium]|nr:D-alanyl-D-alanine carboxypeptidase/D-alanyl-D-alanine-endopeptidase [Gemmatimonadota bacterium]